MQDVREAIATVLLGDSTLQGLLGSATNSVVDENDLTADPNLPWPLLVLKYDGSHPWNLHRYPNIFEEHWMVRCYDKNNGYKRIALALQRVQQVLNQQPLTLVSPTRSVLDVMWLWDTPDYYDNKFEAQNAGSRFRVLVVDSSFGL